MAVIRGNTPRGTAYRVRCSLPVFTVPRDLTRNAEIQCALPRPGHCERLPGSLGASFISTPDGEYKYEKGYDFYEYQE